MSAPSFRSLPRPSLPRSGALPGSPSRAGCAAGLRALLLGLLSVGLPVLVVWAADSRSGAQAVEALRAAGQVFLAAHLVPLELSAGRLSVVPLGLVLLPLALLVRAGQRAARAHEVDDLRGAALLTGAVAGPYALGSALVAALSVSATVRPSLLGALLGPVLLALLGAGAGVLREAGLGGRLLEQVPARLRRLAVPAAAAVLVLLASGAGLVGLRLLTEVPRAAELARGSSPGAVGGVALLLLGLVLVPNAVVWGASWWAGPGFAVGTGTAVGPLAHDLGAVPALPLFAALPSGGLPVVVGVLVLLVPLGAGALAGVLLRRSGSDRPLVDAALCGPLAGVAVGALAWLSGGAAGGAHLAEVGPSPWRCAVAVAVQVAVGATALVWLRGRRS